MDETLLSVERFDPRSGLFSEFLARLRQARRLFTATVLEGGWVLAIGGASDTEVLRTAEIFAPKRP